MVHRYRFGKYPGELQSILHLKREIRCEKCLLCEFDQNVRKMYSIWKFLIQNRNGRFSAKWDFLGENTTIFEVTWNKQVGVISLTGPPPLSVSQLSDPPG